MSKPCESKDSSRKTGSQMWHPVVARNSRGLPLISYISPSEDDLRKQALQVNLAVHVWFCLFLLFSIFSCTDNVEGQKTMYLERTALSCRPSKCSSLMEPRHYCMCRRTLRVIICALTFTFHWQRR